MTVSRAPYGKTTDSLEVSVFTVENSGGYCLLCMDYGATMIGFRAPDRHGRVGEITLGYDDFDRYLAGHPFFGSTVGRVANRIGGARFELDGVPYRLEPSEGPHLLHSGPDGFHARRWDAEAFSRPDQAGVLFSLVSPDGDQGFPGEVSVSVSISLTEGNELLFEYYAESDRPTPLNLTNHAYWNLAGAPDRRRHAGEAIPTEEVGGAIGGHELTIYGSEYLELDDASIPTGRILKVAGTPYDFSVPKLIRQDVGTAGGYDLCYVLDPGDDSNDPLHRAAFVREPLTGRTMDVRTTSPAVQFYSGNKLPQQTDQYGYPFRKLDALCLETQYHPDAVNHPGFPSIILRPDETFRHKTVHRFGTE
jgi:aldose 1-epimerase